jgi:DNA-binding NtrC family response regulator
MSKKKKGKKDRRVVDFNNDYGKRNKEKEMDFPDNRKGKRGKKGRNQNKPVIQPVSKPIKAAKRKIKFDEAIRLSDMAHQMGLKAQELIKVLFGLGVMATINRDLEETVKEGKFRQDLYYRLNVIPLKLPPLCKRGEDVMLLAKFFVDRYCSDYGLTPLEFSAEAKSWMLGYEWPGNVRELQNLMERAVLLAGAGPIMPMHFLNDPEAWMPESEATSVLQDGAVSGTESQIAGQAQFSPSSGVIPIAEMEKQLIIQSLDQTSGNRTKAAELLGISVRTLRNKLNDYKKDGLEL